MKIVIDDKIPCIRGVFESVATVQYHPGDAIGPASVEDADALMIRTRTQCDRALLRNSAVKFIATATIGHDHIDKSYCRSGGIQWQNAPGCNANSVVQYVAAALVKLAQVGNFSLSQKTLGIVGVGHTGSKVANLAECLGMKVLLNDPPRQRKEGNGRFVSLFEIQREADIVSLHVPLHRIGMDATYKLVNADFIARCRNGIRLINTSRGSVVDGQAVKHALREGRIAATVLDVWENEPQIDRQLMELCLVATPHIAGYAYDGKRAGTRMCVQAVSRYFDLGLDKWKGPSPPKPPRMTIPFDTSQQSVESFLYRAIATTYDIMGDDARLRKSPDTFEKQRGNYPLRREIAAYAIRFSPNDLGHAKRFQQIGFNVT